MNKKLKDFKLDSIVNVMWFGGVIKMKVIGYSERTNKVQVQHLDAPGSFYCPVKELNKLNPSK